MKTKSKSVKISIAIVIALLSSGCSASQADVSTANCKLLGLCGNVTATNDKEICEEVPRILEPMNDRSDPDIAKFDKAWPDLEALAFKAEDADLRSSLNRTSISMNAFTMDVKANGYSSYFLMSNLISDFDSLVSACATVLRR